MEPVKLGQLIEGEAQRDAIHVAIAPVVAAEQLAPGQRVGFINDLKEQVGPSAEGIGIVDPWLTAPVEKGAMFYVLLHLGTITSLRHEWSHPAFSKSLPDKEVSMKWMQEYAARHYSHSDEWYDGKGGHYTAEELIEYAKDFLLTGERHVQQGSESLRDDTYEVAHEFWMHFEAITGMHVPDYHRDASPFCCTC